MAGWTGSFPREKPYVDHSVTGTGLIGVIMVSSFTFAEPMNSTFRRLPEGQAPEGAEQLRTHWRRFHLVRTALALGVLACLAAAIA